MIEVDREKFTPEEIQDCERSALYRVLGYLEVMSEHPKSYTKEEIELAQTVLSKIKENLAPVLIDRQRKTVT